MEKRMTLAVVPSIAILLAWQRLFAPEPAKTPPPTAQRQEAAKAGTGGHGGGAAKPPVRAVAPRPGGLSLGEPPPAFPALPVFASDAPDELSVPEGGKTAVSLSWQSAAGVRIDREYTFPGGKYGFV